jgi:gallate dioxygenase
MLGGWESAEVIMWLVMRGALSANVRKIRQSYYLPSMTALATAIYENESFTPVWETNAAYLEKMQHQFKGAEKLEGTYPFTLYNSVKAYRLNKFLHRLIEPEHRKRFLADPEAAFDEAQLTGEERDMLRRRDWRALIHYGVIFFLLEKLGAVVGVSNLHIYAAMRGQSLEEFQKTRNTQVLYNTCLGSSFKDVMSRRRSFRVPGLRQESPVPRGSTIGPLMVTSGISGTDPATRRGAGCWISKASVR